MSTSALRALCEWRRNALADYILPGAEMFALDNVCRGVQGDEPARRVFEGWLRVHEDSTLAAGQLSMSALYDSYHHGRLVRKFLGSLQGVGSHVVVAGGYAAAAYSHYFGTGASPTWRADDIDVFVADNATTPAPVGTQGTTMQAVLTHYSDVFHSFAKLPDDMGGMSYEPETMQALRCSRLANETPQPDLQSARMQRRTSFDKMAGIRVALGRLPGWYSAFAREQYGANRGMCSRLWRWRLRNPRSKKKWRAVAARVVEQLVGAPELAPPIERRPLYTVLHTSSRQLSVNVTGISPPRLNVIRIEPTVTQRWQTPDEFARLVVSSFDLVPCCVYLRCEPGKDRYTFGGVYKALSAIQAGALAFTPCAFSNGRPWIHCCIRTALYAERGFELTAAAPWDYSDENDGHQNGSTWNAEYIEEQPSQ